MYWSSEKGCYAKDLILAIIAKLTTAGGTGYAVEFCGEAVRALSMEGRMTLSNMAIEFGAKAGMIAPDETTFEYLKVDYIHLKVKFLMKL